MDELRDLLAATLPEPSLRARLAVRPNTDPRCPVCGERPLHVARIVGIGDVCPRFDDAEHSGYRSDIRRAAGLHQLVSPGGTWAED